MILTVFRSRLRPEAGEHYHTLAAEMLALARTMPGFSSYNSFQADDGERVTLVEFDTEEHHQAWRTHDSHRQAQQLGREEFYSEYSITVVRDADSHSWRRPEA